MHLNQLAVKALRCLECLGILKNGLFQVLAEILLIILTSAAAHYHMDQCIEVGCKFFEGFSRPCVVVTVLPSSQEFLDV